MVDSSQGHGDPRRSSSAADDRTSTSPIPQPISSIAQPRPCGVPQATRISRSLAWRAAGSRAEPVLRISESRNLGASQKLTASSAVETAALNLATAQEFFISEQKKWKRMKERGEEPFAGAAAGAVWRFRRFGWGQEPAPLEALLSGLVFSHRVKHSEEKNGEMQGVLNGKLTFETN
ncbi:hypothetical protein RRG08_057005 [Elysia crispata]|uniref:Uncharacterized protein n=1 Tax=Elysia crispata TaxID=231223 RepID=A0AAE0Z6B2_9GAST|nr:hypothetical protein RRG08_057005 [Elysia crispata]